MGLTEGLPVKDRCIARVHRGSCRQDQNWNLLFCLHSHDHPPSGPTASGFWKELNSAPTEECLILLPPASNGAEKSQQTLAKPWWGWPDTAGKFTLGF